MDQDEALHVAREATRTALDQAGNDRARVERILMHMKIVNCRVDEAFTIVGSALVEASQANRH